MSYKTVSTIVGFVSRGNDAPFLSPYDIHIVGVDVPETADNWFAYCPRADEAIDEAFLADIRNNGVRTPVDVYLDGKQACLLEGRRRVKAARIVWDEQKEAGKAADERISVRVCVRRGTPQDLFTYNVGSDVRKDKTPMQKAKLVLHAKKFVDSNATLAKMFGCTEQSIKNSLALFDLSPKVQAAVDQAVLPMAKAIRLVGLTAEDQAKALGEMVAAGATSGQAATNAIDKIKRGEKVEQADKTKMRSRQFIGRLRTALHTRKEFGDEVALIDYLLGVRDAVPKTYAEAIEEAQTDPSKPKKEEKAPKPAKEKAPKKAKDKK